MNSISAIHNLFAYQDGDTITPVMGVELDSGFGLTQYWNPATGKVINTDFSVHFVRMYPHAYSSRLGAVVAPKAGSDSWTYESTKLTFATTTSTKTNATLGTITYYACTTAGLTDKFGLSVNTETHDGVPLPVLYIFGNLANDDVTSDVHIYYKAKTEDGKDFTCIQTIPIQSSMGEVLDILMTASNGDTVISNDNDKIVLSSLLQKSGATVTDSNVVYTWFQYDAGSWVQVTAATKGCKIGNTGTGVTGNQLTIDETAINSVGLFKSVVSYNGRTYSKQETVSDIHDPYYIDDGCSLAGESVPLNTDVTFTPKIRITKTGAEVDYTMTPWTIKIDVLQSSGGASILPAPVSLDPSKGDSYKITYATLSKYTAVTTTITAAA